MRIYINLLIFLIISCSASQTFQTAQKPKTEVEQRYQMKTARRSARKMPKTAEDYCELAEAKYKKISEADNEKAIQFYQRAIALKPNYALAYAGLGCAYARKYMDYIFRRDPVWKEKAQEAAQEAAKLEPNAAPTHKALGLVCLCSLCSPTPSAYGDDEWTKAIDEFSLTIDLSPNDSEAYNLRGLAYQLSGNTDAAINDLQHSLSLMPENAEAHKYLGDAYSDMGLYEKVQREYRKAVELNQSGYAFAVLELERMNK